MATRLQAIIDFAYKSGAIEQATGALNKLSNMGKTVGASVASGAGQATRGLDGFLKTSKSVGQAWSDLSTPINQSLEIFQKVGQAAQQAYAYVSEGTQLATTAHQFDALAVSIGSTADALLGELKTATRGTISDANLMASATSIMSLGLADTSEETVRLASLVGKLGWDMNQVTLTMANQSTMRLDSLGLSVSDVTGRVDALKAAGYSADQAFKFAILEAGEEKVKLLGDSADTTAGKLKILETNAANFGDSFKMAFSEELIQNINAVAGGLFESEQNSASLGETLGKVATNVSFMGFIRFAKDEIADLGKTGTETGTKISGMGGVVSKSLHTVTSASAEGKASVVAYQAAMMASLTAIDDRREAIDGHNDALAAAITLESQHASLLYQQTSPAYAELQDKVTQTNSLLSEEEAAFRQVQQEVEEANAAFYAQVDASNAVTGAIYASSEAIAAHNAKLGEYYLVAQSTAGGVTDAFTTSASAIGMNATEIAGLQIAFEGLEPAAAEAIIKEALLREEITRLTEEVKNKNLTIYEARDAYIAFQEGLNNSTIAVNDTTGSVLLMNDSMVSSATTTQNLLDKFGLFPDEVGTKVTVDTAEAESRLSSLEARLAGLGSGGQPATASGGNQSSPDMPGQGYASGADFIVPPGYPNDSYPMRVQSGERVTVTPAGQGRGGDTYHVYLTPANPDNVIQSINYLRSVAGA